MGADTNQALDFADQEYFENLNSFVNNFTQVKEQLKEQVHEKKEYLKNKLYE